MEFNLVEIWLRRDPVRWIAGVFGGLFAGAIALGLAMIIAQMAGHEVVYPAKLMGATILGPSATEIGPDMKSVFTGLAVFELICAFWGFVYAHFTGTNSIKALFLMGLVWGAFSWIFTWNLFLQSSRPILWAGIPSTLTFPICMAYGISLVSVAFFDSIFRGKKATVHLAHH
jgi:hypothetical protein